MAQREWRNLGTAASRYRERVCFADAAFQVVALSVLLITGCGAPGEPVPPSPPIPTSVSDLAAQQDGDGVQLLFSMPKKTTNGDRLTSPPAVEIVRGVPGPNGAPDPKSLRVVYTIPGSLVASYVSEGQVKFTDPVSPAEIAAKPGGKLLYLVRTRASRKRASADSNSVAVVMFPVPEPITALTARVTEPAIELSWNVPTHESGGLPLTGLSGYRVYRGELDPTSLDAASKNLLEAKWKSPVALLASPEENNYRDTLFDFDKTYVYIVRSSVIVDGKPLESSPSDPAIVTPRDIFPPAAPQNVVGNVLPGAAAGSVLVDLSWSINLERDLAGYRVYRSEEQGSRGTLITPDLLLAPAYRDTSVELGHHYWYTVTAVDHAGNESEPSVAAAVDVAQPSS
jgi:hypothetical protein